MANVRIDGRQQSQVNGTRDGRRGFIAGTTEARPGIMTTEFWLTVLAAIGVVIAGYVSDTFDNDLAWALGAGLIASFSASFYLFGAFLLWTAFNQAFGKHDDEGGEDTWFIRFARRHLKVSTQYEGNKLRTTVAGRRMFTPLIIVFLALGTTDLLFALDSIPAVFAVTDDPFLVFSSNICALLGLRALYFVVRGALTRLRYLKPGLAGVLVFVGLKMLLYKWVHLPTGTSLLIISGILGIAIVFSLLKRAPSVEPE